MQQLTGPLAAGSSDLTCRGNRDAHMHLCFPPFSLSQSVCAFVPYLFFTSLLSHTCYLLHNKTNVEFLSHAHAHSYAHGRAFKHTQTRTNTLPRLTYAPETIHITTNSLPSSCSHFQYWKGTAVGVVFEGRLHSDLALCSAADVHCCSCCCCCFLNCAPSSGRQLTAHTDCG